jgi:hypothetical protein
MAEATLLERIDDALSSAGAIRLLGRQSVSVNELEQLVLDLMSQASAHAMLPFCAIDAHLVRDRIVLWRNAASLATVS